MLKKIKLIAVIALIMIGVHIINILLGGALTQFGLLPRHLSGLWGILTMSFIHASFDHLFSNLSIFVVLAWLCMMRSIEYFVKASVFIILVSGILLWIFGRSAIHIGASGWVFGLWGLLVANAFFDRTIKNILICAVIAVLYGGLVFGLLPSSTVSFEGHIAGLISGILFSWLTHKNQSLRARSS